MRVLRRDSLAVVSEDLMRNSLVFNIDQDRCVRVLRILRRFTQQIWYCPLELLYIAVKRYFSRHVLLLKMILTTQ